LWQNLKKKFFFIIFIIGCFFIPPLRRNLIDLLKLPLIFSSPILKEAKTFFSYRAILTENISLRTKLDTLQREYIELKEEKIKSENLKDLLSFKDKKRFKTQLCRIISREPSNWYSSILIDKGRTHHIREGDCVITHLGLVGRVIEVGRLTSKVILISDPQFSCAGIIQRSRTQGIVRGSLLNRLVMRYFEDSPDVKKGDIVVTSALSTFALPAIPIGRITEIVSDSVGVRAEVFPSVELGKLEEVLVILKDTD